MNDKETFQEFILNIQSEILQGNYSIALAKIKAFRLFYDF